MEQRAPDQSQARVLHESQFVRAEQWTPVFANVRPQSPDPILQLIELEVNPALRQAIAGASHFAGAGLCA